MGETTVNLGRVFALVVILALVGLTSLALDFSRVTTSDVAGVQTRLPERIGALEGFDILYCHQHGTVDRVFEDRIENLPVCPESGCGHKLELKSRGEKIALPPDTVIVKKRYRAEEQVPITATVVLSGEDRSSFHRPRKCIQAQGHTIHAERNLQIDLPGRKPLPLRVFELSYPGRDGRLVESFFAFWFVGKNHETTSHMQRMLWMGYERLVQHTANRWAYVSISGPREEGEGDAYLERLKAFLTDFVPAIAVEPEEEEEAASEAEEQEISQPDASSPAGGRVADEPRSHPVRLKDGGRVAEEPPNHPERLAGRSLSPPTSPTSPPPPTPTASVDETWNGCTICHGTKEMQRGPLLEGREAWYIRHQLEKFAVGHRGGNAENRSELLMASATNRFATAGMRQALADHIASLPTPEHRTTVRGDVERGGELYAQRCASCHGPNGRGNRQVFAPRLLGSEDWYMLDQLRKYVKGQRGWHEDDISGRQMRAAVHGLSDTDLKAITAWMVSER